MFYLDHCGTTPLAPEVQEFICNYVKSGQFGNPAASHHVVGRQSYEVLEDARARIAKILQTDAARICFTSGATEANNLIIHGFWLRFRKQNARVLVGAVEHKSALEPALRWGNLLEGRCEQIPVLPEGSYDLQKLEELLADNPHQVPTLCVLMHTNNEVPAKNNIAAISELCKKHQAYFHCDAVQGYVRESLDLSLGQWGSVVISPHKFYGPKGLGVLVLPESDLTPVFIPQTVGGEQEWNIRPGTVPSMLAAGTAVAMERHEERRSSLVHHMRRCDEVFVETLSANPKFRLTVPLNPDVPGIVSFYMEGIDALSLLQHLDEVCVSRGAACTGSGGEKYSHVPKALGLPVEIQANVLRASFGWASTVEEVRQGAVEISQKAR